MPSRAVDDVGHAAEPVEAPAPLAVPVPAAAPVGQVLAMQRSAGNQATAALLASTPGRSVLARFTYTDEEREASRSSPGSATRDRPGPLPPLVITLGDFAPGASELKPAHRALISQLVRGEHLPDRAIVIDILGYTDAVGDEGGNATLREARGGSARAFLVGEGFSEADLPAAAGAAAGAYLAGNGTPPERAANRAVVMHLKEAVVNELDPVTIEGRVPRKPSDSVIPIADFIRFVESVEAANRNDTPTDMVSRLRVQWYSGAAFEQLIPDAHTHDTITVPNPDRGPRSMSMPRGLGVGQSDPEAQRRLTSHASENAEGDNPSPYILLPSGESVDAGHLFLAIDALTHPRTATPYTDYAVPNIDPASWVADVGIASVWTTVHQESGSPDSRAPVKPATPDFDVYYRMSAPEEDILGDVDAYGVRAQMVAAPNQKVSEALRAYYLGASGQPAGVSRRWQAFAAANQLTRPDGSWAPDTAFWADRINKFSDLYGAGNAGVAWAVTVGTPSHRDWPLTHAALDRFLKFVRQELEAEKSAAN